MRVLHVSGGVVFVTNPKNPHDFVIGGVPCAHQLPPEQRLQRVPDAGVAP